MYAGFDSDLIGRSIVCESTLEKSLYAIGNVLCAMQVTIGDCGMNLHHEIEGFLDTTTGRK
jgi:hypothetical protein